MNKLNRAFEQWYNKVFRDLKVSLPGYIVKYERPYADIQLTVKVEQNGQFEDPPQVFKVPVRQRNSEAGMFYIPPAEGALVDLVFVDQSTEEQMLTDGQTITEPQILTRHGINSCYAMLQGETEKTVEDTQIPDEEAVSMIINPDKKGYCGSPSVGIDLFSGLHQVVTDLKTLAEAMKGDVDSPGTGSSGKLVKIHPTLDQLISSFDDLIEKLGQIKV